MPNPFLAEMNDIYAAIKQVRRSIQMDNSIALELRIDSLDALELLLELERRYDLELIGNPQISGVVTVRDLYNLLERLKNGSSA